MKYEIIWKGNQYTNSSSRQGYKPFVIVDHISAGTMNSMDNWFTDPNNQVSSAHYGVSREGKIHQYVDIRSMAWGNGTTPANLPVNYAKVVSDMGINVNANLYTVSIEHEGTDGNLTEVQFQASVWLHKHIQGEIKSIFDVDFELDDYYVIGHFMLSKIKPSCPGPYFPWKRLYEALAIKEEDEDIMDKVLDYEPWAWEELNKWLGDAYNLGDISDWKWVQQARDKTMKYKDLLLLKVLIDERRRVKQL